LREQCCHIGASQPWLHLQTLKGILYTMLRGQASLQELIGRSFLTRKRPPKSKKKAAAVDSASTSHDLDAMQSVSACAAAPNEGSLQPGHALCPVCGVPTPERMMNTHSKPAEYFGCVDSY